MTKSSSYRGVTLFRPTGKWRAQISAGGKTTSLGDHDSEEEAARAFDRAAVNKHGMAAKTNFPIADYADEVEELQGMPQQELVAMLRSKARKSGTQTSHYRGVSLLKQTGKWHAQINVGGKQVHLGFYSSEAEAARAYDRAAINKGVREGGKIITNFDINDYKDDVPLLARIDQQDIVQALGGGSRKAVMDMLSEGFKDGGELFGNAAAAAAPGGSAASGSSGGGAGNGASAAPADPFRELALKAERATPKPTAAEPLYAGYLAMRKDASGRLKDDDSGTAPPAASRAPSARPASSRHPARAGSPDRMMSSAGPGASQHEARLAPASPASSAPPSRLQRVRRPPQRLQMYEGGADEEDEGWGEAAEDGGVGGTRRRGGARDSGRSAEAGSSDRTTQSGEPPMSPRRKRGLQSVPPTPTPRPRPDLPLTLLANAAPGASPPGAGSGGLLCGLDLLHEAALLEGSDDASEGAPSEQSKSPPRTRRGLFPAVFPAAAAVSQHRQTGGAAPAKGLAGVPGVEGPATPRKPTPTSSASVDGGGISLLELYGKRAAEAQFLDDRRRKRKAVGPFRAP